jgi:hypothetical protein
MEKVKKQELESLFVEYKQALALKELGFDEPCLGHYDNPENPVWITDSPPYYANKENVCLAPLKQQVFRWFREKYQVFTYIHLYRTDMDGTALEFEYYYRFPKRFKSETVRKFKTYEEAEQACLDKLIEICKTKQD